MNPHQPTAQRIKPILQAMERSINSARRKRLNLGDADVTPPLAAAAPAGSLSVASPLTTPANVITPIKPRPQVHDPARSKSPDQAPLPPDEPARLKARPKRFNSAFVQPFDQNAYRSQAG